MHTWIQGETSKRRELLLRNLFKSWCMLQRRPLLSCERPSQHFSRGLWNVPVVEVQSDPGRLRGLLLCQEPFCWTQDLPVPPMWPAIHQMMLWQMVWTFWERVFMSRCWWLSMSSSESIFSIRQPWRFQWICSWVLSPPRSRRSCSYVMFVLRNLNGTSSLFIQFRFIFFQKPCQEESSNQQKPLDQRMKTRAAAKISGEAGAEVMEAFKTHFLGNAVNSFKDAPPGLCDVALFGVQGIFFLIPFEKKGFAENFFRCQNHSVMSPANLLCFVQETQRFF